MLFKISALKADFFSHNTAFLLRFSLDLDACFFSVYRYANLYLPYGRHLWVDEEMMQAGQELGFSIYYWDFFVFQMVMNWAVYTGAAP